MSGELQRVWLILAKVRVLAENPAGLSIGSEAFVQCFVPETILEIALTETDRLLREGGMRRTDVLKCISFDEAIEDEDEVPDFVKDDINEARNSRKALTGTFFVGRNSASFQCEEQNPE